MKKKLMAHTSYARKKVNVILLKMKILTIIIFAGSMVLSASTYSQKNKIDLRVQNSTLTEILNSIEKKSEFIFIYNANIVSSDIRKSINVKDENIEKILDILFQGIDVSYRIDDRQVFLYKKDKIEPTNSFKLVIDQPRKKILSGKVTDEKGEAIPGVTVVVDGTSIGNITNIDGVYTLEAPLESKFLLFSFIGYATEKIPVGEKMIINVNLKSDILQIGEVVITAQARGQKNAIKQQINSNTLKNVVAADRLQENPDANATEAIGRLPGISVLRSGGEGTGLVIRGLEPRYTSVTLNGIQLPSTSGSDRGTSLSSISQYALQGVEVYKSLTADMDANSVAGTVSLKLRKAPNDFHTNIMVQGGYNQLNNYFGNYKLLGEMSNRYLKDKLGIMFTATDERVNRSIQTMSAGYGIDGNDPNEAILLSGVNLNNISSIIYRRSALLSLDFKVSPGTTLMVYGMYNSSKNDNQSQSKSYGLGGAGSVGYSFASNPNNNTEIFQSCLSGESTFKFLNIKSDYGISYSIGNNYSKNARNWNFTFDKASTSAITDIEHRKMDPTQIVPLFTDDTDKLLDNWLNSIGVQDIKIEDRNLNAYLNLTIPFKMGDQITGNIKLGGMYRVKNRKRDDTAGSQVMNSGFNVFAPKVIADSLSWIVRNANNNISAVGISGEKINNFLNGDFNFGNQFSFDRLNKISDIWENVSEYYLAKGPSVYLPVFGTLNNMGYAQNIAGCILNDQDIKESYYAGYLMPEINIGKYVMFLPGVRLEKTHSTMNGFYALPPQYAPPITSPTPGSDTSAVRSDQYLLPMVHLRIKPTESFYVHLAYTQTLSRPDFNSISPNYFVNSGWTPFSYTAGNPQLIPEHWTNYDAQCTFYNNKLGLLSVTAFYKTVKDKIWNRSYQRIKGDPIIDPFPDNALVNVNIWENHAYTAYVNGLEFEWQTSFYYLPKPFNYLTLSVNYTYTQSKTSYPYTRIDLITPAAGGRPVPTRLDSITTGTMLLQPKNIANVSLGFNNKGFNAWLSFQYNGQIYTGKNYRGAPRLDSQKDYFYRWDLQLTQKFAIRKIKGFEVIANIANISDFTESQRLAGDIRPIYKENYGMTTDLGLRYRF